MKRFLQFREWTRTWSLFTITAAVLVMGLVLVSCGGGGYGSGGGGGYSTPGMFTLLSPTDGEPGVSTTPNLTWNPSSAATGYYVYLKKDGDPSYMLLATVIAPTLNFQIVSALTAATTYDWYVTAYITYGGIATAPTFTFTTGP